MKQYKTTDEVDFCIVGSGAAGGVVARQLARAGFSVVVLEQGPWHVNSDFTHDEFFVNFRGGFTNDFHKVPNTVRAKDSDAAKPSPIAQYAMMVGGSSSHFTANYWRFPEIEFQQAMAVSEADRPEAERLVFRVGVHLGDVIVDGDDLYGDGVNVAARLEAEAPPGGIVISGDMYNFAAGRVAAVPRNGHYFGVFGYLVALPPHGFVSCLHPGSYGRRVFEKCMDPGQLPAAQR